MTDKSDPAGNSLGNDSFANDSFANDAANADPPLGLDGFQQPDQDLGLSLDELGQAYAELLSRGDDPYDGAVPGSSQSAGGDADEDLVEVEDAVDESPCDVTPLSILEAMLFVGTPDNTPLASKQVAALMRGVRPQEVDELVVELNAKYDEEGSAFVIISEGSGYRMVLREELAGLRNKFYGRVKEARLSQPAVDVLAIVAYNQPLTRVDVDGLRGKPSGSLLTQLVRRRLLAIQRSDTKPAKVHYITTERFLDLFELESLDDLPRSQELSTSPSHED